MIIPQPVRAATRTSPGRTSPSAASRKRLGWLRLPSAAASSMLCLWAMASGQAASPSSAQTAPKAASEGDRAQHLAARHYAQARTLSSVGADVPDTTAIDEARIEIEAAALEWKEQIAGQPLDSNLLTGISELSRRQAQRLASSRNIARFSMRAKVSLELALAIVAVRNPELRASRERLEASVQRLSQAGFLEDLLVQYRAFVREIDTKVGPQTHRESLSQVFPFPALLSRKGRIAQLQVELAMLDYQTALRRALNETARQYFHLLFIDESQEILRLIRDMFERMEAVAIAQLRVAKTSQADALKAQAALDLIATQLADLASERGKVSARVSALLDIPGNSPWGPVPRIDLFDSNVSAQVSVAVGRRQSQEMKAARLRAQLAAARVDLSQAILFPLPASDSSRLQPGRGAVAGPTRRSQAAFPAPHRSSGGAAKAAAFAANAAYLEELRLMIKEADESRKAVEAEVEFRIRDAHYRIETSRRDYETYEDLIVPKNDRAFHSMMGSYNTGRAPFIEYLDAGRSYLEALLASERSRRDLNLALIDLQDAAGLSAAVLLRGAEEAEEGPRRRRRHH